MKLRLRENSIRLRLLQSEIKFLRETNSISETISFPAAQKLIYTLKISSAAGEIGASFDEDEITIEIPKQAAENWFETETVGLENKLKISGAKPLKILIEKDFVCVDRPFDEDNADAFPHPEMVC